MLVGWCKFNLLLLLLVWLVGWMVGGGDGSGALVVLCLHFLTLWPLQNFSLSTACAHSFRSFRMFGWFDYWLLFVCLCGFSIESSYRFSYFSRCLSFFRRFSCYTVPRRCCCWFLFLVCAFLPKPFAIWLVYFAISFRNLCMGPLWSGFRSTHCDFAIELSSPIPREKKSVM